MMNERRLVERLLRGIAAIAGVAAFLAACSPGADVAAPSLGSVSLAEQDDENSCNCETYSCNCDGTQIVDCAGNVVRTCDCGTTCRGGGGFARCTAPANCAQYDDGQTWCDGNEVHQCDSGKDTLVEMCLGACVGDSASGASCD